MWPLIKECHGSLSWSFFFLADDPMSAEQFHQEYNPPVEGSYTGMNKQEKIVPVTDPSNDREQVQQRFVCVFNRCAPCSLLSLAVNLIVMVIFGKCLVAIQTD